MSAEPAAPSQRRSRRIMAAILAVLWLGLVGLPPAGLAVVRKSWMESLDRPEARSEWETFRGAMRAQSGRDGPVQRKVPKSVEPPGLVWLRDHFALACGAWLLFGTVLWGVTAFFIIGAGSQRAAAAARSPAENQPRRDGHHEKENDRDAKDAKQG
jgi:hypothetical protein